ncbi:MAG: polynucleotide adenylyltransferase PcnB [Myxococcales bacterium FL481]|nr:MAG: polynucleotide adenylyltransferase PcnB [Myxococcales bacterium FL481]
MEISKPVATCVRAAPNEQVADTKQETRGLVRTRDIDPDSVKVVRKLLAADHEAYLVGGCVRDLYLRRKPKDFDVATSATPEQIRRLFRNSRVIGRRFRLVHVYFGPKVIETSTFRSAPRSDDDDLLIRHDNEWGSVEDDARRRDFTVNGLFYDIETGRIVDFVDGLHDLDAGVIRTIGDAETRFREDPVRMIRAIKFAARLDFQIEPECWAALLNCAGDISKCSRARVLEELYKLMRGGASRRSFELLHVSGLLAHIWPPFVELLDDPTPAPSRLGDAPPHHPAMRLLRHLEALDDYVLETRQDIGNGVLAAVLFAPFLADEELQGARQELDRQVDDLMAKPSVYLGVARRDRELARQIIMAHRRMALPSRGGRRRSSLVQRQYFHDALIFLGISVEARGGDGSELRQWQALAEMSREGPVEPSESRSRRKRSRRRRRTPEDGRAPTHRGRRRPEAGQ